MRSFILFLNLFICFSVLGQHTTWKEKLGYDDEDILLIIHGDDLGVTHAVNIASIDGLENGIMNSVSIMVPCPWFEEIADYFVKNPQHDYGLHLTLTAEWKHFKWDGLFDQHSSPGLHNEKGYLYEDVASVVQNASLEEVENEIRAQIDKALLSGLKPTHLDSHMGTLFAKKEFLQALVNLGEEYKMPVFLPVPENHPWANEILTKNSVIVNNLSMNDSHLKKTEIFEYYDNVIKNLKPGLNEIIVHLGKDNEELRATCIDHPYFGSEWRQFDWDYIKSKHVQQLLKKNDIKLITWREIQQAIYGQKSR